MKYRGKKKVIAVLICSFSILMCNIAFAHPGRTDSSGGHKDNQNKSGLGSYHYHCGGYPAHLHTNGVCPYLSGTSSNKSKKSRSSLSNKSKKSSSSSQNKSIKSKPSSSSKSKKSSSTSQSKNSKLESLSSTKAIAPSNIDVINIKINEDFEGVEVGKSKILTATIEPDNATNKSVIWSSSNESIATINTKGEIIAKKIGVAYITATSSNGKTSTIKINIEKPKKEEFNTEVKNTSINSNNVSNNSTTNNNEDSNPLAGILTLGLIGYGGYIGYKKHKK